MVAKKTTTKAERPTKKEQKVKETKFDIDKEVQKLETAMNEEKPKSLADKSIDEMSFDELFALKGIIQEEVNWLIYCYEDMQMRRNSLRINSPEAVSVLGGQQQIQAKIGKLNNFNTRLHHKITNYILEKWVD